MKWLTRMGIPGPAQFCLVDGDREEVAVTAFAPLPELPKAAPDARRAEGQVHKLPYVPLFSILTLQHPDPRGGQELLSQHRHLATSPPPSTCTHRRAPARRAPAQAERRLPGLEARACAHRDPVYPQGTRPGGGGGGVPPSRRPAPGGADAACRTRRSRFGRLRSFTSNPPKATRTDTLSQDRYRAALAKISNLPGMCPIPER